MSFVSNVYQSVFRRTSTFVLAIMVGAFAFERAFDQGGDAIFNYVNRGKLYKDVKDQFAANKADE